MAVIKGGTFQRIHKTLHCRSRHATPRFQSRCTERQNAISDITQTRFTAEIEQLKLLRGNAKPAKGGRIRGKSTS